MQIVYDWPDIPIGTPLSFGGLLCPNGEVVDISDEDATAFKLLTGRTLQDAAKDNIQLTIVRKKVS